MAKEKSEDYNNHDIEVMSEFDNLIKDIVFELSSAISLIKLGNDKTKALQNVVKLIEEVESKIKKIQDRINKNICKLKAEELYSHIRNEIAKLEEGELYNELRGK